MNVSLSKNWEHLQNKFVGTGHPDMTRQCVPFTQAPRLRLVVYAFVDEPSFVPLPAAASGQ